MDAFFLKKDVEMWWYRHLDFAFNDRTTKLDLPVVIEVNGVLQEVTNIVYDGKHLILKVDNEQNSN